MFWKNYSRLCDEIGKAPNTVAAEIGIKSTGTVTGWKNGAKPRNPVLRRLADYFGVSVEDLIRDDDDSSFSLETGNRASGANEQDNFGNETTPDEESYDTSEEFFEALEVLRSDPDSRALLMATKGMTKSQVQKMMEYAKFLKTKG